MRGVLLLGAFAATTALAHAEPAITLPAAKALLSPGERTTCTTAECLIEAAYAADDKARAIALALYRDTGSIAGVGPEELMDGGYRGKIRLVPQLPLGAYRKHLTWTDAALRAIETFFVDLYANKKTVPSYRWHSLSLRFVRSIKKRTPSAYAFDWTIEYNVMGSLLTSAPGVLETLWHELFHSNDFDHGDWSAKTLQTDYDAIVAKCGTKAACLTPYAPNKTRVKATGTYYAFQPNNGNGVHEYAAELAVRYFTEQRQMLRDGKLAKPAFKCGPVENARAWQALVVEFFGGRDLVPACS
jgi:predicted outer membrane lipoprotein